MIRRAIFFLLPFIALTTPITHGQTASTAFDGYVTRFVSPLDFDLNGLRVISSSKTKFSSEITHNRGGSETVHDLYLGQPLSIYGKVSKRKHKIEATEIVIHARTERDVTGYAVIDRILSPLAAGELLLRADGYPIRINSTTKIKFKSPLTSLSSVSTNLWITYHGSLHEDGIVVADAVVLSPNIINKREDKLLEKTDYNPSAVSDSAKQNSITRLAFGVDPKTIPPYHDTAMQAHIEQIGKSLIPQYQKDLPESDETKILFQFQLVDGPEWRNAWALPSGVILVPRQVVAYMQNDSQLAALLADAVSCDLEKQTFREQPSDTAKAFNELGGFLGGWGLGSLVAGGAGAGAVTLSQYGYAGNIYGANTPVEHQSENQRGRVALSLMYDAGYDLKEAPIAWWIVSANGFSLVEETKLPNRAIYLYKTIGAVWYDKTKETSSSIMSSSK